MSVSTVRANIAQAIQNRHLGEDEAKLITSKKDGWFSAPESVGTRVDQSEYDAIKGLFDKVQSGEIDAAPQAKKALEIFLAQEPTSRLSHAISGGAVGGALQASLAGVGGAGGATMGLLAAGMSSASVSTGMLASTVATAAGFGLAGGVAVGYAAGVVQGLLDD